MICYSHLFKSFPQFVMIHTVKGFSIALETEVDVFLEFPCFLCDPANVANMVSGSSAFSKPRLNIWKFSVHIMLKPSMRDFKHNLTSMGDECNCLVVWTFFSTALLGNWDEDWHFQSSGHCGKRFINWSFNTLATWYEEPTHCKRSGCWERLKGRGKGDDRGWDGWMALWLQ